MSCNQGDFVRTRNDTPPPHGRRDPDEIESSGPPILVLSNWPETINEAADPDEDIHPTLYKCSIPVDANVPSNVRIFLWHLNHRTTDYDIGAILSYVSDNENTATVSNVRVEALSTNQSSQYAAVGLCLSKVQLFGTFNSSSGPYTIDSTETVIWSEEWPVGYLIGAVIEFDVVAPDDGFLRVRTAKGTLGVYGDYSSQICRSGTSRQVTQHPRGWWPRSEGVFPVPGVFDLNPQVPMPDGMFKEVGSCEPNLEEAPEVEIGVDAWGTQSATLDPYGTLPGNRGLYGVNATYRFVVTNSSDDLWSTTAHVVARNTSEDPTPYFGSGQIMEPVGFIGKGIPPIYFLLPDPDPGNVAHITENQLGSASISVEPNETIDIEVRVAHAGAATLPVTIFLLRKDHTEDF